MEIEPEEWKLDQTSQAQFHLIPLAPSRARSSMSSRLLRPAMVFPILAALASYVIFRVSNSQPRNVDLAYGFDLEKVMGVNIATVSRGWGLGATAQALLELRNLELTVFEGFLFPEGRLPTSQPSFGGSGTTVHQAQDPRTNDSALPRDAEGMYGRPAQSCYSTVSLLSRHYLTFVAGEYGCFILGTHVPKYLQVHRQTPPR
jgi:hypothetical protein